MWLVLFAWAAAIHCWVLLLFTMLFLPPLPHIYTIPTIVPPPHCIPPATPHCPIPLYRLVCPHLATDRITALCWVLQHYLTATTYHPCLPLWSLCRTCLPALCVCVTLTQVFFIPHSLSYHAYASPLPHRSFPVIATPLAYYSCITSLFGHIPLVPWVHTLGPRLPASHPSLASLASTTSGSLQHAHGLGLLSVTCLPAQHASSPYPLYC